MYQDGELVRMLIMAIGMQSFVFVNFRFVQPEYLVVPPDAEEPKIKEPRNWFWQKAKKEDKKE
jgi:hypothetical protein